MLKYYYSVTLFILYYIIGTMYYAVSYNSGSSAWLYVYLVFNILMLSYWYFLSWGWNDEMTIHDFEGNQIKVVSYSFNPFNGIVEAYISKDDKYKELNKHQQNLLIESNLYLNLTFMIMFNIFYFLIYNIVNFLNRI